jgi:tyrosine-protein kinase Etk/Wzc
MANSKNKVDYITLQDLWQLVKANWYWFILSCILTSSIAIIYLAVTPPVFTSTASVRIKNTSKNNAPSSTDDDMSALGEMSLFKSNTDVQSEIHIFQSPILMEEVVRRLKIDYKYSIKYRGIRNVELYKNTPISIELNHTLSNASVDLTINLLSSGDINISQISIDGVNYPDEIQGKLFKQITLPKGSITITPTIHYALTTSDLDPIKFTKRPINAVAKGCEASLNAKLSDDDAPIIQLSYDDINAQRAEDILSMLIIVYNENWIKDKNQITSGTSQFINERLKVIENELGNVDENISNYKSNNLIPDVDAVSNLYLSQASANTAALTSLQNQLAMARYIQIFIKSNGSKNQLLPANTGIGSTNVEGQIDKYNELLLQKNSLIANSSEGNPLIADMTRSLKSMRKVIALSVNEYISMVDIQISNMLKDEKNTNQKIASNPKQAKHLLSEERQQKVKEELYLFLLQKREENELSQAFTAYNTKVINRPEDSDLPSKPHKNSIFLLALAIGLVLPAIIIILRESMNTMIHDRKDLEGLAIPFVGEIPYVNNKKKKSLHFLHRHLESYQTDIVVQDQNRNIVNEAFRNVRANIDFMRPQTKQCTVILFTSLNVDSGKTFVSSNLAVSMAIKDSHTLLLDADLRKACLSTLVGSPHTGLSNYLNGNIDDIKEIIVKDKIHSNLDVIPVGIMPPNPSELLLNKRFSQLITELRSQYDYIFIDCPPVELISDTSIISRFGDLTLFIIREGFMDKRMLPDVEQLYTSGRLKNMAIALNGVNYSSQGRYSYHKYGYYGSNYIQKTI